MVTSPDEEQPSSTTAVNNVVPPQPTPRTSTTGHGEQHQHHILQQQQQLQVQQGLAAQRMDAVMGLENFRFCSVLGRGHFGKVKWRLHGQLVQCLFALSGRKTFLDFLCKLSWRNFWLVSLINSLISKVNYCLNVFLVDFTELVEPGNTKGHCTVDLLSDWFGLVCSANKNKNCQLSYSWFLTSQTGGQQYSDASPFSIPWLS